MSQFKNLVFEGGGVKGIAYAGALQVLEAQGIIPEIQRVAGTSAGAITAALVALGASSQDVFNIVGNTKFREFMDDSFGVLRDLDRLRHDYGWYKGDAFADWMQKQVYALGGDLNLTFAQLAQRATATGGRCKQLYTVGTNLSLQMPIVYSAETTPDVPIWQAVRISMSIPLFFAAVKAPASSQICVDGGVSWNYPLDLFDDKKYVANAALAQPPGYPTVYDDNHVYNKETLGFRVDTADEIKAEKDGWNSPPVQINDFFDYLKALVGFMNDISNKLHLHKNDWDRTVFIDAAGVKATEFDLADSQIQKLVDNGKTGATDYFNWFNNPGTNPPPRNK